ncbi:MAG: UPF0489 family protein [Gemmatimonadales bacterium]
MRILDLDLDFFLDRVGFRRPDGGRLDPDRYHPWPEPELESWLDRCLPPSAPRPRGRVVTHHREAFYVWRELVERGALVPPLEIVHVDAHADLGVSNDGHRYLMTDLLHRPPADRRAPAAEKLRDGNYLLFAVACRWVGALTYVTHPQRERAGRLWQDDRPTCLFRDDDPESGILELRRMASRELAFLPPVLHGYGRTATTPLGLEPAVTFRTIAAREFAVEAPFDFVLVARSPDYTPETSDRLLPRIMARLAPG